MTGLKINPRDKTTTDRAIVLRARSFEFRFPRPALIMGIVNVTPDSFSDGGQFLETNAAVDHALRLVQEGADLIDLGGESTRPSAIPTSEAEELRRVIPVLEQLRDRIQVPISIDTRKPNVARVALAAGASLVNDVEASRTEPEMWKVVAEAQAGYVAMHMQGAPATMQVHPSYEDVCREIYAFFEDRLRQLEAMGVSQDQVVLDVGIGFGKDLEHNLELLARLNDFTKLRRPLLLGVSRKSFIGKLLGVEVQDRLAASIACGCWAVQNGVQILRTHDVRATWQAIRMLETILARETK